MDYQDLGYISPYWDTRMDMLIDLAIDKMERSKEDGIQRDDTKTNS